MDELVNMLRAAADGARLRMLALCADGELTVTEITDILGMTQPAVSRHLKILTEAGLLTRFREGAWVFHRLADEGPGGVRRALLTTGVAASVSTLTTVASFASLTLAGSRGVRGMGVLVVVGLVVVFVATAVLLPTAWAAGWKVSGRAPGDAVE